jgi:hypothetical protein
MSCNIPVLTINDNDCLGDSLGKHNYNALALDTSICNLSSVLFSSADNVSTFFEEISSVFTKINSFTQDYTLDKFYHIQTASTTVRLLSSFWSKYHFSVQYPVNLSILQSTDTVDAPSLSATDTASINDAIRLKFNNMVLRYLNNNFTPTSYPDGTTLNVILFLYNTTPDISDANSLITETDFPVNRYNYLDRTIQANFTRDNLYFTKGITMGYYKQDNIWNYIGVIV